MQRHTQTSSFHLDLFSFSFSLILSQLINYVTKGNKFSGSSFILLEKERQFEVANMNELKLNLASCWNTFLVPYKVYETI